MSRARNAAMLAAVVLAGCAQGVQIREPVSARPGAIERVPQANGAVFQDGISYRPLFEDRRARYVGDTLTVSISERTTASRSGDLSASRSGSVTAGVPTVTGLSPFGSLQGTALSAQAASAIEAKDSASANNLFSGSITVTVIEVLPNGNLLVAGEKRLGINTEVETLRFSGVVNPVNIVNGNTVSSVSIADARIEAGARSNIEPKQVLGFLGRFFLSFIPFR